MTTAATTVKQAVLPEVQDFLSQSPLKSFIGGEWVGTASHATFTHGRSGFRRKAG